MVSNFDLVMLLVIGDAAGTAAMGDDHSPLSLVLVVLTLVGLTSPCARLQGRLHRRAARLPSEHRCALRLRFVDGWASTAWRWRWVSTAPPLVVLL